MLSFDDPAPCEIQAHLIDVSLSGFRAAYNSPALSPGQLVGFQRVAARGNARVIWTRISGAQIESGFVLV